MSGGGMLYRFAHIRRFSLQKCTGILQLNLRVSPSLSFGLESDTTSCSCWQSRRDRCVRGSRKSTGAAHMTGSQRPRVLPEPTAGLVCSHHDSDKYHPSSLNEPSVVLPLLVLYVQNIFR
jgi:hypothetical protein